MLSCPDFSGYQVVVVGDLMLDRYWHGDTSRISPEAPVPVVKIDHSEERVGGAANVAMNVQALGAHTTLIGAMGEDDIGKQLNDILQKAGVLSNFFKFPNLNTTLKLRVLGRHQQLIRLDFENKIVITAKAIIEKLQSIQTHIDILILSDYAKGVISEPQEIIQYARSKGIKVLVDPKNADLTVYRGATMLTPNLGEFEATVGPCENAQVIEEKGRALLDKLDCEALLVTRGSQGMTLLQKNISPIHIPAKAREVFDITGAGDTVIGVLGASIAAGRSFVEAAHLANLAAGIAVGRLGTATITCADLQTALNEQQGQAHEQSILSVNRLVMEVLKRKKQNQKVVMTNGCFDILHAGHITYLQQARALGDCLIIAVNDDESVRRLKGKNRPINNVNHRMQVLAALRCVDYVVSFSEDTPEILYQQITPNILVKGGDYKVEQIAGAKHVIAQGGSVEILTFVDGCSTTNTIAKMAETEEVVV